MMPTVLESICCCEIPQVEARKNSHGVHVPCITLHPGFQTACLDVWVLQIAYYSFRQHYGEAAQQGAIHEYVGIEHNVILILCIGNIGIQLTVN